MQGLIIENISNLYKIKTENKIYEANARGKLKKEEISGQLFYCWGYALPSCYTVD